MPSHVKASEVATFGSLPGRPRGKKAARRRKRKTKVRKRRTAAQRKARILGSPKDDMK